VLSPDPAFQQLAAVFKEAGIIIGASTIAALASAVMPTNATDTRANALDLIIARSS
jgi:hypothetical protein